MFYNDPLEVNADVWTELLTNREVTREQDIRVLKTVYESKNHEIRASEIASKLNLSHHAPLNAQISRFSKRVIAKTGVQPPLRRDGKPRWWHVPFLGYEKDGSFPWIMRPELARAFESLFGSEESEVIDSGEITIEDTPLLHEVVFQIFCNSSEPCLLV